MKASNIDRENQIRTTIEYCFADEMISGGWAHNIFVQDGGKTLRHQISSSIAIELFSNWKILHDILSPKRIPERNFSWKLKKDKTWGIEPVHAKYGLDADMDFIEWDKKVYEMLGEYEDDIAKIQKIRDEEEQGPNPFY